MRRLRRLLLRWLGVLPPAYTPRSIWSEGEVAWMERSYGYDPGQDWIWLHIANSTDPENRRIQRRFSLDEAEAYAGSLRLRADAAGGEPIRVYLECTCGCWRVFDVRMTPGDVRTFADEIDAAVHEVREAAR